MRCTCPRTSSRAWVSGRIRSHRTSRRPKRADASSRSAIRARPRSTRCTRSTISNMRTCRPATTPQRWVCGRKLRAQRHSTRRVFRRATRSRRSRRVLRWSATTGKPRRNSNLPRQHSRGSIFPVRDGDDVFRPRDRRGAQRRPRSRQSGTRAPRGNSRGSSEDAHSGTVRLGKRSGVIAPGRGGLVRLRGGPDR